MLQELLAQDPNNQLARYGIAMEHASRGEVDTAVIEFQRLLDLNPDYTNAYFMAAQALVQAQRTGDARKWLERGIANATRTGNNHARSEMEAMLLELGS